MEEVEFDGGFAAEDGDEDPDFALAFVQVVYRAQEIGERSFDDFDGFADGKGGFVFGSGLGHKFHDGVDFGFGQGSGLLTDADKAGYPLCGTDCQPGIVVDDHFDQHVAGEELFFDGFFLAVMNFDLVLGGDQQLKHLVFQIHGFDPGGEGEGDFVFVAGVGVDNVPVSLGIICLSNDDVIVGGSLEFFGHN